MGDVYGKGQFAVAVNVANEFEELHRFETMAEANAFEEGWNSGSDKFGGDGFAVTMTEGAITMWGEDQDLFFRFARKKMTDLGMEIPK